jgi:hypothetical protein
VIARHRTRPTSYAVQPSLGEEAFAAAWAAGQTLPIQQAIAEALQEAPAE